MNDSITEFLKRLAGRGLGYTDILINGVRRQPVRENAETRDDLLQTGQWFVPKRVVSFREVVVLARNAVKNPENNMSSHAKPAKYCTSIT